MIKVLILEDEPQLLENITSFLMSFEDEFEVVAAPSGEEGLGALERDSNVDILLTDVRLPGIDGIEVVRRTLEKYPRIKIIVMTAFASSELRSQALQVGALRFLEKPLDLVGLPKLLREMVHTDKGWTGAVRNLDIFELTQLYLMARKTTTIRVTAGHRSGTLVIDCGNLTHASTPTRESLEAFTEMIEWEGGTFEEIGDSMESSYPCNVNTTTTQFMMEAARLRDEHQRGKPRSKEEGEAALEVSLTEFVASSAFPCDVCVLGEDGAVIARACGRTKVPEDFENLGASMRRMGVNHPRDGLRTLLLEDAEGTIALRFQRGNSALLMATNHDIPLGPVLVRLKRLEVLLQESEGGT